MPAQSVSGRMPHREREEVLQGFHDGRLRVLCACDILNEGWDCPDIEVLLMARPTLSRVIYLQQLGRGTRKATGKECLIVFDFVDNANRYNQSLSAHRVLGKSSYRPGGLLLATFATLFFVPTFFSIVHGWLERRRRATRGPGHAAVFDEFDQATE